MRLALTDEQEELRLTLRSYFADLVQERAPGDGRPDYVATIRRMGADGWLGIGWPVEYGGQARGPVDQMIFVEESHWAGVPLPLLTLNSVGPAIMQLGTDEQKQRILPGILRGEVHFSIGYTEPTAGTDLAALRTRAVRDGDEYVINGEKLYTSAIQYADYVWLATRTDPEAPKHKGLSVFIVPTDTPGFSWTPLPTVAGEFTSSTYYEDVRVPAANLVGGENQGWTLMTNQLNHERVAICPVSGHPAQHRGGPGLGPGGVPGRRAPGHRPGMGPGTSGPAVGTGGVLEAAQLERGLGRGQGPPPGRRIGHQGLRQRVRPRGVPAPARDRGAVRVPARGLPGCRVAWPARATVPEPDHLHLRWGHQRDPARHHRLDRPRDAARTPVGRRTGEGAIVEFASVDGTEIAYDDTGGPGPVVLLAHGLLMDRTMFAPQVEALRDGFRVVTWDARGFGETRYDGRPFTYWDLAADGLGLLDALGVGEAVVGGMSQGGFISLRMALLAPARIRALILLDTQAGTEDPDVVPLYREMVDAWSSGGLSDQVAEAIASALLGEPELSKVWMAKWKARPRDSIVMPARALVEREDLTGRLGEITAPALVVHGTADAAIPIDRAEALAAGLSGSNGVHIVQDGTHAANLTHPGAVNDAIADFLRSALV